MSREHEGLGASAALMQHAGASWEWQVQRNNDPELLAPGHLGWLGEAEPPSGGFRIPHLAGMGARPEEEMPAGSQVPGADPGRPGQQLHSRLPYPLGWSSFHLFPLCPQEAAGSHGPPSKVTESSSGHQRLQLECLSQALTPVPPRGSFMRPKWWAGGGAWQPLHRAYCWTGSSQLPPNVSLTQTSK